MAEGGLLAGILDGSIAFKQEKLVSYVFVHLSKSQLPSVSIFTLSACFLFFADGSSSLSSSSENIPFACILDCSGSIVNALGFFIPWLHVSRLQVSQNRGDEEWWILILLPACFGKLLAKIGR